MNKSTSPIKETVKALSRLYSTGHEDRPENVLWNYPAAERVVEALKILIHVMFPGMYSSEKESLETYFDKQLKEVSQRLLPELNAPFLSAGSRNPAAGKKFRRCRMFPPRPGGFWTNLWRGCRPSAKC